MPNFCSKRRESCTICYKKKLDTDSGFTVMKIILGAGIQLQLKPIVRFPVWVGLGFAINSFFYFEPAAL